MRPVVAVMLERCYHVARRGPRGRLLVNCSSYVQYSRTTLSRRNQRLQLHALVRRLLGRYVSPRSDQLSGRQMIRGAIDRIHGAQLASREAEYGKPAAPRIPAKYEFIRPRADAGHLDADVELISREPRHGAVALRAPHDCFGDAHGLVHGVLHGFQAHAASGEVAGKLRAIADSEDAFIRGAKLLV